MGNDSCGNASSRNAATLPAGARGLGDVLADCRKEGPLYDLPIAISVLAASEQMQADRLSDYLFVGELALDGKLRPIKGALLFALLAKQMGKKGIFVPPENANEAAVVEGLDVYAPGALPEAAAMLKEALGQGKGKR